MDKKSDLFPECQKFVKKLFSLYSKEKATKKPIVSFDRVPYIKGHIKLWVCLTLKSNRPKERAKILDDFDHNTLR